MARLKREESEALDRSLIHVLRKGGRLKYESLAKSLGVSTSTVYNRIAKLEKRGVIKGYSAIFDRAKSGYGTGAILLVTIDNQGNVETVSKALTSIPEVEAVYEIGGEADIVALLYASSIEELRNLVNEKINSLDGVSNVTPLVIMKTYKESGLVF